MMRKSQVQGVIHTPFL